MKTLDYEIKRSYLDLPDARLYYEVCGEGHPIIFLHGLSGNHSSWWQQIPRFAKNYQCITFSQRGFPPSTGEISKGGIKKQLSDLTMLLDKLGINKAAFVAQSMGGWSVYEFLQTQPDRVSAIVLSSTSGTVDPFFDPAYSNLIAANRKQATSCPPAGRRMQVEQPDLFYLYRQFEGLTSEQFRLDALTQLMAWRNRDNETLAAVKTPVLFLAGAEDPIFPAEFLKGLPHLNSLFECHIFADVGHSPYFEVPDAFNTIVHQFLNRALSLSETSHENA